MIAEFESRILALIDNMVDHASDDELFAGGYLRGHLTLAVAAIAVMVITLTDGEGGSEPDRRIVGGVDDESVLLRCRDDRAGDDCREPGQDVVDSEEDEHAAMRGARSMSVETIAANGAPFADTYALAGAATAIDAAGVGCARSG